MDWDALLKEATQYLQDYIRIETVNPPGNEIEGARFLKKILEAESIPCEILSPRQGKEACWPPSRETAGSGRSSSSAISTSSP